MRRDVRLGSYATAALRADTAPLRGDTALGLTCVATAEPARRVAAAGGAVATA